MELSSIDQTLLWNPPVKGDKVKKNTWIARKIKVRVNSALDRSIPRYGGVGLSGVTATGSFSMMFTSRFSSIQLTSVWVSDHGSCASYSMLSG